MTGLAQILADRTVPGAFHWIPESDYDVAEVEHVVELTGHRFAHVGGGVSTAAALHEELADTLDFPDYYGRNLDALNDALRDVPSDVVLLWDDWAPLAEADRRTFDAAVELLGESLTVLLRGDGPDPGVPELS